LIPILLLLALSSGAAPATEEPPAGRPSSSIKGADMDLLRDVRELAGLVAEIRGRELKPPPVAVRADRESRRMIADVRARSLIPADRLEARGRAWSDLGLGDAGTLRRLWSTLAADLEGVASDPSMRRVLVDPERLTESDFIFVSEGDTAPPPPELLKATGVRPDEPLLVHMLAHLGQGELQADEPTTDALLARAAWREGEANLLAIEYLFRTMGIADDVIRIGLDPGDVVEGALLPAGLGVPETVGERLLDFIYREGFARAAEAHRAGGWSAVERAAAERTTTWAVLHPEGGTDAAEGAATSVEAPPGHEQVDRDRLGAQAIIDLVSVGSGKDNLGLLAAEGWAGDDLYRFETPDAPERGVTLWVTRWRDERGADDFDYGIVRALRARFPSAELETAGEGRRLLRAGERVFRIERRGTEIRVRVAPAGVDAALEPAPPRASSR
jgi:hypothetical protein